MSATTDNQLSKVSSPRASLKRKACGEGDTLTNAIDRSPSIIRDVLRGKHDAIAEAKNIVLAFQAELDAAQEENLTDVLSRHTAASYHWRGMYPFLENKGAAAVVDVFWRPLRQAFGVLQRRDDIFLAGNNDVDDGETQWTCNMGHLMGLFDREWLGIRPTGRLVFLRYCEFNCMKEGKIVESCLHCDILAVMQQAGQYPLPPMTGAFMMSPGPRTHDGIMLSTQKDEDSLVSLAATELMNRGLIKLNERALATHSNDCPPEELGKIWAHDMLWWGPAGIGATGLDIPRYQRQHQMPFRSNLHDKKFNKHVARIAEGKYVAWFGWPNLSNKASGGFLGLPGDETDAMMRVVDVYRREGDKLVENWVFIDVLFYLKQRGLDVLERNRELSKLG